MSEEVNPALFDHRYNVTDANLVELVRSIMTLCHFTQSIIDWQYWRENVAEQLCVYSNSRIPQYHGYAVAMQILDGGFLELKPSQDGKDSFMSLPRLIYNEHADIMRYNVAFNFISYIRMLTATITTSFHYKRMVTAKRAFKHSVKIRTFYINNNRLTLCLEVRGKMRDILNLKSSKVKIGSLPSGIILYDSCSDQVATPVKYEPCVLNEFGQCDGNCIEKRHPWNDAPIGRLPKTVDKNTVGSVLVHYQLRQAF